MNMNKLNSEQEKRYADIEAKLDIYSQHLNEMAKLLQEIKINHYKLQEMQKENLFSYIKRTFLKQQKENNLYDR